MNDLTKIDPLALAAYEEKGLDPEKVQLCVKLDMNRDGIFCDNWLFVNDEKIIFIGGGIQSKPSKKGLFGIRANKTDKFVEVSYYEIFLKDIEEFHIEEMTSVCRFTALLTNGDYELLSKLTYSSKNDLFLFIKYVNKIKNGEDASLEEEDNKEKFFCPRCGQRYADPEHKICSRCIGKRKTLLRTIPLFLKYKWYVVAMFLLLVVGSVLSIVTPYFSAGFFYDEVLDTNGQFYGQLLLVVGIIVGTKILSVINTIVNRIVSCRVSNYVIYDLKNMIFEAIQRLSLGYFTNRQTGGIMNQVNNDSTTAYWFFCFSLPRGVIVFAQAFCVALIMFSMSPLLSIITLVALPIVLVIMRFTYRRLRKLRIKQYAGSRKTNSILSDVFSGVRVVKSFSKEDAEITRFNRFSRKQAQYDIDVNRFSALAHPLTNLPLLLSGILVWAFGGWMVMNGQMTYGMLATFIAYSVMIQEPIGEVVKMVDWAANCINALERMFSVTDAIPEVEEKENPVHIDKMEGKVEFKNVCFSYEKNRRVIKDISFTIEPGQMLGIVGHTGAGKSTLANLLLRLYEVEEGEILIDGINVKDLAFADLRKNIAIVSQETYLFSGTIFDNIRYAHPEATKEDVINAAKISGAHDFIIKMPNGYLTRVGTGNQSLSGGERQRISIARAILMNPRILIMDEATAAMDTQTERQIQNALEKLVVGRTTISIAHRLSTLRNADKLIVIENGEMPESGTHSELIAQKGIYYKLFKLQMEALKNAGIEE